jgi:hypothetical protein
MCKRIFVTVLALTVCLLWSTTGYAFEDVTSHGATGDGVTDDTAAVQSAINALPAAGGSIYFPEGTYIIAIIGIAAGDTIVFYGDGADVSVLKHKASSAFSMLWSAAGVADDLQFRDLGFDGNAANQTVWTTAPLELKCVRVRIDSCSFVGTKHAAIILTEVQESARILNSSFTGMAEHGGSAGQDSVAILVNATTTAPGNILINGNYFQADAPAAAGKSPGGIMIDPGTSLSHRVTVRDNVFKGIGQAFAGDSHPAVHLYRNSSDSIIQGNKFIDTPFKAILAQRSSNLLIADNIIRGESTANAIGAIEVTGRNDAGVIDQNRISVARNIIHNMPSCWAVFLNFDAGGEGNDIHVIDNIIENLDSGITLSYVHGGLLITGNSIRDIIGGASTDDAIRVTNCEGWAHIYGNYINNVTGQQAISFNDGSAQAVEVVVSENSFENVVTDAVDLRDIDRAIVTNNVFRGTPGSSSGGVLKLASVPYAEVHGNIAPAAATTSISAVSDLQEYGNSWDTSFRQSLSASKTWNPPSIAAGAMTLTTVTVPGAAAGDPASASHTQLGANFIVISAHVQSADLVTVILLNTTGSAKNLASGTLRASVFKY